MNAHAAASAIDAPAARAAVAEGAFLLDVRTPAEHAESSIDGAVLIPLDELDARIDEIPTDREIVVHCAVGPRAERAAGLLVASGRPSRWLPGGVAAWHEAT